ncbi:hypothetical protein VII00023_00840, partial [Vibrio ichthyoenteri ATCC 700023]
LNHDKINNGFSCKVFNVKQSNENKYHKERISPQRKQLPLEIFSKNEKLLEKHMNHHQIGLNSAFMGIERALNCELFTAESLKIDFRGLATNNGSLRAMATGLQGLVQFGDCKTQRLAEELLNKQIQSIPFSQFGTYSGVAAERIATA